MRTEIKVAIVGFLGVVFATTVPRLIEYSERLLPNKGIELLDVSSSYYAGAEIYPSMQITDMGHSGFTILDVKVQNFGGTNAAITGIELHLEAFSELPSYDSCAVCSRDFNALRYDVTFSDIAVGSSRRLSVLDVLHPDEVGNLQIVFGSSRGDNYVARAYAEVSWGNGEHFKTEPFYVIVFSDDDAVAENYKERAMLSFDPALAVNLTQTTVVDVLANPPGLTTPNFDHPSWLSDR